VLAQYFRSGDALKRLLGQTITPTAQNFLDNGASSSVTGNLQQQIRAGLSSSNKERELLINLLTTLGYSGDSFLAKKEFQNQSAEFYLSYIFDMYNVSIVPLANIINPPKNKVVAAPPAGTSAPPPAQTQPAAQTQQSTDPSSKKSNVTNWDQYVKATPNGGAAVKSAWEAFAATGKVKPDYYSFVAWYKNSKASAGPLWKDDPGTVARLLQAKASLFTPYAAPAPSITPGSATAQTPKP
jgi:hypothetical protein